MKIENKDKNICNTNWEDIPLGIAFWNPENGICMKVMIQGATYTVCLADGKHRVIDTTKSQVLPDAVLVASYGSL